MTNFTERVHKTRKYPSRPPGEMTQILAATERGEPQREIAGRLGVSQSHVSRAVADATRVLDLLEKLGLTETEVLMSADAGEDFEIASRMSHVLELARVLKRRGWHLLSESELRTEVERQARA
jgi:transcriptional regulator with XRE-family HTH domain